MFIPIHIGITLALLFGIVGACSLFTNAIEWLGHRFKLSEGAVGSILAAVGTALPETLVPVIALLGGAITAQMNPESAQHLNENAEHIGIGAILGAPFLLSTLAMGLSGLAVFFFASKGKRGKVMHVDLFLFKRDLNYFFPVYGLVFLASFISVPQVKWAIGAILIITYGVYVYRTLNIEHIPDDEFHLDPLMFGGRQTNPATWLIVSQTLAGLGGIMVLAHLFVNEISRVSSVFSISPLVLSLIIAPIATELPEKFNSVVWLSKKKDNLALGNITGAMVFQSCIPTFIGIVFTPWQLDFQGSLSVLLCFLSIGFIYANVLYRRVLTPGTLVWGLLFYFIFLAYSVYHIFFETAA